MSKRFNTGLVVGKFCPLHRGHELVIRRATEQCARVFLLSYTKPEFSGCEPERREQWLATLFPEATLLVLTDDRLREFGGGDLPHNDAAAGSHRRLVAWVCEKIWRIRPEAVFTSEEYGPPFAASLTRHFKHPVAHVSVDPARAEVPVSGTQLRSDIHAHRLALSPEVYASFVERVCLLGGESSGKSTLAAALAQEWRTTWVPEFGRELWLAKAGQLQFEDLLAIAREQVAREDAAVSGAHRFLFCDTSPLTTLFYCREMFGQSDPRLDELALRPYARTVLCMPDFPFVQDGTRRPPTFRDQQHAWYLRQFKDRRIPFLPAAGALRKRVDSVSLALCVPIGRE